LTVKALRAHRLPVAEDQAAAEPPALPTETAPA
jgi:hypothetical protein